MLDEIVAATSSIRDDIVDAEAERLLKAAAAELARDDKRPVTVEGTIERYLIDLEVYPGAVEQALREYTAVWASTCQGAASSVTDSWKVSGAATRFPTVIVDEAARANPLDLLIPVTQASERVILVGDHRQLPQVIDEQLRDSMVTTSGEPADGELLESSLFERLFQHVRRLEIESGVQRAVTLDQQFRMHPDLAEFVSNSFYAPHGESFTSGVSAETMAHDVASFAGQVAAWLDVPASAGAARRLDTGSWEREPEVDKVAELVEEILASPGTPSVGVITFYAGQRDRILEALLPKGYTEFGDEGIVVAREWRYVLNDEGREIERLRIGTVDSFQGKEFDVVILSMVRSTKAVDGRSSRQLFGFLTSENRFCVAVSRQRRLLLVVGDHSMVDHEQAYEVVGLRQLARLCGEPR
jgi:superfamily I DNA and/or RNA helicase